VAAATDTDEGFHLRTLVLLVVLAICVATAPPPASFIGIVAAVLISVSAPARYRGRKP
jgi:hypothetical protein